MTFPVKAVMDQGVSFPAGATRWDQSKIVKRISPCRSIKTCYLCPLDTSLGIQTKSQLSFQIYLPKIIYLL